MITETFLEFLWLMTYKCVRPWRSGWAASYMDYCDYCNVIGNLPIGSPSNFPRYSKQRQTFFFSTLTAVFAKFPEPRVKSDGFGLDSRTGSWVDLQVQSYWNEQTNMFILELSTRGQPTTQLLMYFPPLPEARKCAMSVKKVRWRQYASPDFFKNKFSSFENDGYKVTLIRSLF